MHVCSAEGPSRGPIPCLAGSLLAHLEPLPPQLPGRTDRRLLMPLATCLDAGGALPRAAGAQRSRCGKGVAYPMVCLGCNMSGITAAVFGKEEWSMRGGAPSFLFPSNCAGLEADRHAQQHALLSFLTSMLFLLSLLSCNRRSRS